MGKKIVLAIFGGIAVFGLILILVGFMLGGQMGSMHVQSGKLMYSTSSDTVELGNAPRWMNGINVWGWHWRNNGHDSTDTFVDEGYIPPANAASVAVPFNANDLKSLKVDISAGYLIIQPGDTPGLVVDGKLPYTSNFSGGEWTLETDDFDFSHCGKGWKNRFWWDGVDYTTTFTLTVPGNFDEIEIDMDAGEAIVKGITVKNFGIDADAGGIEAQDVNATTSNINVSAGSIDLKNFTSDICELYCSAGSINMKGNIRENLVAKCEVGAVSITMPRPGEYGWEASAGLGAVEIDGHAVTGMSTEGSGGSQDAKPYFELDCDFGNITVNFT